MTEEEAAPVVVRPTESQTVRCSYREHQASHVRVSGRGWVCGICDREDDPRGMKERLAGLVSFPAGAS